jgi:hypothetical protein
MRQLTKGARMALELGILYPYEPAAGRKETVEPAYDLPEGTLSPCPSPARSAATMIRCPLWVTPIPVSRRS